MLGRLGHLDQFSADAQSSAKLQNNQNNAKHSSFQENDYYTVMTYRHSTNSANSTAVVRSKTRKLLSYHSTNGNPQFLSFFVTRKQARKS